MKKLLLLVHINVDVDVTNDCVQDIVQIKMISFNFAQWNERGAQRACDSLRRVLEMQRVDEKIHATIADHEMRSNISAEKNDVPPPIVALSINEA